MMTLLTTQMTGKTKKVVRMKYMTARTKRRTKLSNLASSAANTIKEHANCAVQTLSVRTNIGHVVFATMKNVMKMR